MNKLPKNWQEYKLKDLCVINYGKGLGKSNIVNGNIPVYSSGGIIGFHNTYNVNSEGVIIGRKGNAGSVFYSDKPFFCIDTAFYIEPNNQYDLKYLFYKLVSMNLKNHKTGTTIPGLIRNDIYKLSISIPPLDEQKRIASALSKIDAYLENTIKLIEEKERFKRGIAKKLLTCKEGENIPEARFKGFEDEWKEYNLSKIGVSYNGLRNKKANSFVENCNAKYITYKTVYDKNKIDINRLGNVFIGKNENQNLVKYGDIFFTISSETPDEVAISSVLLDEVENTYLNSFCFGFRFDFNILLPEFARYHFHSNYIRKSTYRLAQGITRYNISKKKFLDIIIYLPSLEEQEKIGGYLSLLDEEIDNLKKQKELIKEMKRGAMQKLLSGEVRLLE